MAEKGEKGALKFSCESTGESSSAVAQNPGHYCRYKILLPQKKRGGCDIHYQNYQDIHVCTMRYTACPLEIAEDKGELVCIRVDRILEARTLK